MKYVLFYESPAELDMDAIRTHFPAHRELWSAYGDNGTLLLIGPFEDPREGAMGVFTSREAAEAFAGEDPFVRHGLVARWRITGWNEALLDPL